MDWLIKLVIAGVVALIADAAVKKKTGRHIHEHAFEWWCKLRDSIVSWCHQNSHRSYSSIVLKVVDVVDEIACRGQVRIQAMAKVGRKREIISTEVFSKEEFLRDHGSMVSTIQEATGKPVTLEY